MQRLAEHFIQQEIRNGGGMEVMGKIERKGKNIKIKNEKKYKRKKEKEDK